MLLVERRHTRAQGQREVVKAAGEGIHLQLIMARRIVSA
jgi:hypothetical protein